MKRSFFVAVLISIFSSQVVMAETDVNQTKEVNSGTKRVTLIELYTSEGCSSCPPADKWLSSIKQQAALWERVVPIALHVDYWNYIGWNDRFANRMHSDRQRNYHYQGASNGVYTPGFFVDGKEWRGYFTGDDLVGSTANSAGELNITITGEHFTAQYTPAADTKPAGQNYKLMVALLGMNLSTEVKHGENRGKTLDHDFVVLNLKQARGKNNQWQGSLPMRSDDQDYAIAAWVTGNNSMTPVQAVGGPL